MTDPDPRFDLANERTLLAWQRTSIGLVAAAVGVAHFLDDGPFALVLAFVLFAGAGIALLGGQRRYQRTRDALRRGTGSEPGPEGAMLTAVLMIALLLAAGYVVAH